MGSYFSNPTDFSSWYPSTEFTQDDHLQKPTVQVKFPTVTTNNSAMETEAHTVVTRKLKELYSEQKLSKKGKFPKDFYQAKDLSHPEAMFDRWFRQLLPEEEVTDLFAREVLLGCFLDNYDLLTGFDWTKEFKRWKIQIGNKLKLKLVLTGLQAEPNVMIKKYGVYFTDFGVTHAAVQVGPWILDWTQAQIVIPRPLKNALLILDLDSKVDLTKSNLLKIAEFVCDWNKTMQYAQINLLSHSANCHTFVKIFLKLFPSETLINGWKKGGLVKRMITLAKDNPSKTSSILVPDPDSKENLEFQNHSDFVSYYKNKWGECLPTDSETLAVFKAVDRRFALNPTSYDYSSPLNVFVDTEDTFNPYLHLESRKI